MTKLTKISDENIKELKEHLKNLNQKYNKNCTLSISQIYSHYKNNQININLETEDPLFTLYHEFGHCLQDYYKSIQNKNNRIQLMMIIVPYMISSFIVYSSMINNIISPLIGLFLFFGLLFLFFGCNIPICFSKKIKKANHLIELRCDRFAAKNLKRLPNGIKNHYTYQSETFSHPDPKIRIETIKSTLKNVPKIKKK